MLQSALQMVRCDPSSATGFAPAEFLIGRQLVYPIQFSNLDIDLTGTTMTVSLVKKLKKIRENNFMVASKKIKKTQSRYKRNYDKKMKATPFKIKIGDKVQYKRHKSKSPKSKTLSNWCPLKSYHLVLAVDKEKKRVVLQTSQGRVLARTHPFDRIRKFRGKLA